MDVCVTPSMALQRHILKIPPQSVTGYWSASGSFSLMPVAGTQWHWSQCKGWTFTSDGVLSSPCTLTAQDQFHLGCELPEHPGKDPGAFVWWDRSHMLSVSPVLLYGQSARNAWGNATSCAFIIPAVSSVVVFGSFIYRQCRRRFTLRAVNSWLVLSLKVK